MIEEARQSVQSVYVHMFIHQFFSKSGNMIASHGACHDLENPNCTSNFGKDCVIQAQENDSQNSSQDMPIA
jgi:hypothetical protein